MAAPSTCIACHKPFAENRELAAIPDASKVAFDPVHRRVWRICASCGEWNLLGAEAAAAALPELEARFAAVTSSSAPELGFAPARISSRLELLRVGRADLVESDDSSAVRLRTEVDKRITLERWLSPILGIAVLSWLLFTFWPSHSSLGGLGIMLFGWSTSFLLIRALEQLRGKKASPVIWLINGALVVAGAALALRFSPQSVKSLAVGLLAMIPVVVLLDLARSRLRVVRVKLLDRTTVRLAASDLTPITLSWTPGATDIALHALPNGRSITGPDVARILRMVVPWTHRGGLVDMIVRPGVDTEGAYALLSTVGGLGGLLRALEGFCRDNEGRVLVADLPRVYLVALDLALSDKGAGSDAGALREKALEAAAVAHEAEDLDRR